MKRLFCLGFAVLVGFAPHARADGTLRFGLEFDPDVLDPARNVSYTDRVVFNAMCDQLLDIDPQLNYVPELATAWEWSDDRLALTLHLRPNVVFQDGEPFTADAMRQNMERYRNAPESVRKTELKPVVGEDVIDPLTLRIRLSAPYAPLLSLLANRPGTPLSPRILAKSADEIAAHPVCAGPFSFRERVTLDHIALDRFGGYWNAAAVDLDHIVFRTIVDPSVRAVNLQAGALDIVNRLAPTDIDAVQANPHLRVLTSPSLGFQPVAFNVGNGPGTGSPFGKDVRVRVAFEKSIDRAALNQVVFDGRFVPSNQTEAPGSRYWDPNDPVPPRDLDGARALLRQAGLTRVPVRFLVSNDPVNGQIGQVIQSMAGDAGFDVTLTQMESAAQVDATRRGQFDASMLLWSGRPDPDGNASVWLDCHGSVNWTGYCSKEVDALLQQGAATVDPAARVPVYRTLAETWTKDHPYMILYHYTWIWGLSDKVSGFAPRPDGIARPVGVRLGR